MPAIFWHEIRNRALNFSRSWSQATREQVDKQTFWNEFFDVFRRIPTRGGFVRGTCDPDARNNRIHRPLLARKSSR